MLKPFLSYRAVCCYIRVMEHSAQHFFEQQRKAIREKLKDILCEKAVELCGTHRWKGDFMDRFRSFCLQGKMIRGGLIVLSFRLFRADMPDALLELASAMEILHSSLLIHDDIMDRDATRRGKPTIFSQYRRFAVQHRLNDPGHFGESFGICAGDIGFFLAFGILSSLDLEPDVRKKIQQLWSSEFTSVGLAQMQDVYLGSVSGEVHEEDIMNLYRYKTARYTFSLPLASGAVAAGVGGETVALLEELGEYMGTVFQLKDDELDLFGDERETGKPVGTDMKEGKKTLLFLYLSRLLEAGKSELGVLTGEERAYLQEGLRPIGLTTDTLMQLRTIATKHGIVSRIGEKIMELNGRAESLIDTLQIDEAHRDTLISVLRYNMERRW